MRGGCGFFGLRSRCRTFPSKTVERWIRCCRIATRASTSPARFTTPATVPVPAWRHPTTAGLRDARRSWAWHKFRRTCVTLQAGRKRWKT